MPERARSTRPLAVFFRVSSTTRSKVPRIRAPMSAAGEAVGRIAGDDAPAEAGGFGVEARRAVGAPAIREPRSASPNANIPG